LYIEELPLVLFGLHKVIQDEVTEEPLRHFLLKVILQGLYTDLLKVNTFDQVSALGVQS
jgi:hypothetical protein